MDFRSRLLATLRQVAPLFEEPGVIVVGSEVPNLLEAGAAATLVVSQDVDIGLPVKRLSAVKLLLERVQGLSLLEPLPAMPDPHQHREVVRSLLLRLESRGEAR